MALFERGSPRKPEPFPYDIGSDTTMITIIVAGLGSIVLAASSTGYQASLYGDAGAGNVAGAGAFAGFGLIIVTLLAAATLYRRGFSRRAVGTVAAVAAVLALGLAILPPLAAGAGWLRTVLSIVVGLVGPLIAAVWIAAMARYLPMWWAGSGSPRNRSDSAPP